MSIKLEELLKLPSLREAKVVAGKIGLNKLVSSISVLEHTDVNVLEDALFENDEFYGSEIVISGLINIKDNVDAQCHLIRRLHAVGEVGLILYYVGIFMPKVDDRLIELANELGFTIIVMPENEMTLRYSEVIYEVVEAIVKKEVRDNHFSSELIEQISHLPSNQRNIDTMLKILSDRTRCSIVLMDNTLEIVHAVTWPRINNIQLENVKNILIDEQVIIYDQLSIVKRPIIQDGIKVLQLCLVKENDILEEELISQMLEVVQVFMNIWGEKYSEVSTYELMKAIINNESIKMRRLARMIGVDVTKIEMMWLIEGDGIQINKKLIREIQSYLGTQFQVSLVEKHDNFIVALMDNRFTQEEYHELATYLSQKFSVQIIICGNQNSLIDIQKNYFIVKNYFYLAKKIYPFKRIFSKQEIIFAGECSEMINAEEQVVFEQLKPIQPLIDLGSQGEELLNTLSIFLLETENSINKTADILYLHKNTIKYRLGKLHEILQYPVTKLPESYILYKSIAIWRVLKDMK